MSTVRPSLTRFAAGRPACVAAALALVACAASLPSSAGEASTSFAITIRVLPEGSGTCTARTTDGSPQVTCRPSLGGVIGAGGAGNRNATLLGHRPADSALRLAGELIEVGAENHYAWTDEPQRRDLALAEYTSTLVSAHGRDYVQVTVSW